jgi:small-conductance mechanosensitive channel
MKYLSAVENLPPWLGNLALIAVIIAAAVGLRVLLYFALAQWLRLRRLLPAKITVAGHFGATGFFVLAAALWQIFSKLFRFPDQWQFAVDHTALIVLIVSITWFLMRAAKLAQFIFYDKFDINAADNFRQRKVRTQIQFIFKVVILFLALAGFASVLMSFQSARRVGASLLASAGVASVVIGFAAQKSLGNFVAGFQIAFTQPIRIDDVVIVEGEWGRVEEITLTYVVVNLWDLRRMILPITYFIEKPFQNWTRNSANILGYAYIYADYSLPVEEVRKELRRAVEDDPLWDRAVCILQVTDTTEKTIQLRALVSARNASDAFDIRCNIREKLVSFIQKNFPESIPKNRAEIGAGKATLPVNV